MLPLFDNLQRIRESAD